MLSDMNLLSLFYKQREGHDVILYLCGLCRLFLFPNNFETNRPIIFITKGMPLELS
jgi:hypothetical protein